jgi:signal transduction histidine kinase
MFATRLTVALCGLGLAAALQGAAAVWSLGLADRQVQRGRVASDIHVGFVELSVAKQRLRAWVAQRQMDADADAGQREALLAEMRATLARLEARVRRAPAADSADLGERYAALATLAASLAGLERAAREVQPLPPAADARSAWQALSERFDRPDGHDLRALLSAAMQREAAAVERERAAADASLARVRLLWAGISAALGLAALLLALHFLRALRRPLAALRSGADAWQRGELAHRIGLHGDDEFARLAGRMDAMAAELQQHRAREAQERQRLGQLVQARTAELRAALDALQQADHRRRRLLADVSHELRTPATAIRGEAQVALRGRDKGVDEYKDSLARIADTAVQLGRVIDDLLAVARDDLDALALHRRVVDLGALLAAAVEPARALAAARGVAIELAVAPDVGAPAGDGPGAVATPVRADPDRLRQLLLLLLDNAVRYSHPGGRVRVRLAAVPADPADPAGPAGAAPAAPQWEVRVEDEGIGIAAHELPRVFERHFRGAAARAHSAEGSGLGLTLADALARGHGGSLHLASTPGRGTVVRLRLPRSAGEAEPGVRAGGAA